MKHMHLKPLTLALIASFAVAQAAVASVEPRLHEDVDVTPGRSISPADEDVLSSSASRVLHHIARAHDDLNKKDATAAKQELNQAETLLGIIQNNVPTTLVKSRVWGADSKTQYQDTEEVPAASVPIYATLDVRTDFDSVKMRAAAGKTVTATPKVDAKASAETAAKPAARETEARDAALYFEELDLPLKATRHFVAAAQNELAKNRLTEADQALRAALDNVDYVSVYLPDPLLAARINLERAETHYTDGKKADAKVDVDRAIAQLTEAENRADSGSREDVQKMLDAANSLEGRLDQPGLKAELRGLWKRAEVHADRAMAYTEFGWSKLRHHDPMRSALIEAKRYISFADIDANIGDSPSVAKSDLEQAKTWLDKAAAQSGNDQAVYLKDIRAVVDSLLSGQAKTDPGEMNNLKQQLSQAIART